MAFLPVSPYCEVHSSTCLFRANGSSNLTMKTCSNVSNPTVRRSLITWARYPRMTERDFENYAAHKELLLALENARKQYATRYHRSIRRALNATLKRRKRRPIARRRKLLTGSKEPYNRLFSKSLNGNLGQRTPVGG